MIAIIDYDAGNIRSVEKAFHHLGVDILVTKNEKEILAADGVVLPGVGSFGDAMDKLYSYDLVRVIHKLTKQGHPFLGICLGLQLLFEESEESPGVQGLGILKGCIKRIPDSHNLKIPHIGWNSLTYPHTGKLFEGIASESYVYFVHSYYLQAADKADVCAVTEYGTTIHAAVERGNIYACQFHPEKSSETGLKILSNFIRLTEKQKEYGGSDAY